MLAPPRHRAKTGAKTGAKTLVLARARATGAKTGAKTLVLAAMSTTFFFEAALKYIVKTMGNLPTAARKDMTISDVLEKLFSGTLNVCPRHQRGFVWPEELRVAAVSMILAGLCFGSINTYMTDFTTVQRCKQGHKRAQKRVKMEIEVVSEGGNRMSSIACFAMGLCHAMVPRTDAKGTKYLHPVVVGKNTPYLLEQVKQGLPEHDVLRSNVELLIKGCENLTHNIPDDASPMTDKELRAFLNTRIHIISNTNTNEADVSTLDNVMHHVMKCEPDESHVLTYMGDRASKLVHKVVEVEVLDATLKAIMQSEHRTNEAHAMALKVLISFKPDVFTVTRNALLHHLVEHHMGNDNSKDLDLSYSDRINDVIFAMRDMRFAAANGGNFATLMQNHNLYPKLVHIAAIMFVWDKLLLGAGRDTDAEDVIVTAVELCTTTSVTGKNGIVPVLTEFYKRNQLPYQTGNTWKLKAKQWSDILRGAMASNDHKPAADYLCALLLPQAA